MATIKSIEEKAKAYDEALKVLHKYDGANIMFSQDLKEEMFPELKESEDEKIRKWIEKELESKYVVDNIVNNEMADKAFAWIKKQCEHANFRNKIQIGDKVTRNEDGVLVNLSQLNRVAKKDEKQGEQYPKFRIGDTIKKGSTGDIVTISEIDLKNREYRLSNTGFIPFKYECLWKLVEQKHADKVEPKFKVGDWIVFNGLVLLVNEVVQGYYRTISIGGIHNSYDWNIDNAARLWTIQDAKDGDVLCTYECCEPKIVFILKGTPKIHYALSYHCYYNIMYPHFGSDSEKGCLAPNDKDVKPVTKEQRDLLFQKMKEAGYEWDAEKLELKKIEQKSIKTCAEYYNNGRELKMPVLSKFQDKLADILMHREYDGPDETEDDIAKGRLEYELAAIRLSEELLPLAVEQKPAEVEPKFKVGDTIRLKNSNAEYIIESISDSHYYGKGFSISIVGGNRDYELVEKKPTEWSEEDEKHYRSLLCLFECVSPKEEDTCWFKTLKDRVQLQQKWSKEDIVAIDCAADVLSRDLPSLAASIKRLKSLRPHWKPSDEQIEALLKLEEMHVLEHEKNQENAHLYMVVKSIREQLLKLREE